MAPGSMAILVPGFPAASAAARAASSAFSSRNCRYVFVLGTVSDKNSRLSILATAAAKSQLLHDLLADSYRSKPTNILVRNIPSRFPI